MGSTLFHSRGTEMSYQRGDSDITSSWNISSHCALRTDARADTGRFTLSILESYYP